MNKIFLILIAGVSISVLLLLVIVISKFIGSWLSDMRYFWLAIGYIIAIILLGISYSKFSDRLTAVEQRYGHDILTTSVYYKGREIKTMYDPATFDQLDSIKPLRYRQASEYLIKYSQMDSVAEAAKK